MSKTSTDPVRHALNGPTMGTRWSALFHSPPEVDEVLLKGALQAAVDEVDMQMSTWKADSDLMRLNRAPVGEWAEFPRGWRMCSRLVLLWAAPLAARSTSGWGMRCVPGDLARMRPIPRVSFRR